MIWKKQPSEPETYLFENQGRPYGEMRFDAAGEAQATFGKLAFQVHQRGFWTPLPQIQLPDGTVALTARTEHWWGSTQILHCGTRIFKAGWKNDPLAEILIYETDPQYPLLTVGLKTEARQTFTQLQVSDGAYNLHELPFLLAYAWYAFQPASKQGVDDGVAAVLVM
ncbi:MAG: hypothetical protein ABIO24_05525 [Saprospiraceae bacterium]